MNEKIGVFICDCGTNISDCINTNELADFVKTIPDVTEIKIHRLWCSEEGREEMKKIIKEKNLSRVVIAACSPKQHELTFQKVLSSAGLNPYLMQMANIREQIAWVTKDKTVATKKAIEQLNSAIKRVRLQQPLEKTEIDCKNDFLVIGAGIAGISAALTLAQKNRKVYLVEKEAWIGGKVVSYEEILPKMECAPCMLEPKLDDVLHNDRITLLTNSDIENVKGFFGNFEVRINNKARLIDSEKCLGCGACYEACPVKVKNKFNGNLSERHAIYSAFAGVLPNLPVIDKENCLRFKGEDCKLCQQACAFEAIDYNQTDKKISAEVGAIVVATGFDLYPVSEMKNISAEENQNILSSFQFERLLSTTGPTEGKIKTTDGSSPKSIAFIHCMGSRDKNYKEYCSAVCCAYTLKHAHMARKKLDNIKIYEIYSDWCLPGKNYQEFYNKTLPDSFEFIRINNPNDIKITNSNEGIKIEYDKNFITVDMTVLAPAIIPAKNSGKITSLLGITTDKDGFYSSEHDKLSPATTTTRGIYIAGCASGPKDISQAVMQGQAAAGMALNAIVPGEKIELEVATAKVEEKLCGGCYTCLPLCPYQAISFDKEKKTAFINEILCKGCGVCVAGCPSGAIINKHFTEEEIFSEIEGVLS